MLGGDFDNERTPYEKNNNRYNDRWPFLFNVVINNLNLREIELSRRQYTWASNLETPTYEKLDRVLVSTEWVLKLPGVTVPTLARGISDHNPLLLDTRTPSEQNAYMLKFGLAWLLKDYFYEKVTEVW
jgi:endonuclease/exonuclease/phosphatase family metal-dependent hydrolase